MGKAFVLAQAFDSVVSLQKIYVIYGHSWSLNCFYQDLLLHSLVINLIAPTVCSEKISQLGFVHDITSNMMLENLLPFFVNKQPAGLQFSVFLQPEHSLTRVLVVMILSFILIFPNVIHFTDLFSIFTLCGLTLCQ